MCYMWVLFPFQIELSCGTKLQNLGSKAEGKGHKGGEGGVSSIHTQQFCISQVTKQIV